MMDPTFVARVYLTLRCQLACGYCSNGQDIRWTEADEIDGAAWLARVAAMPADEIVFTGGEPMLHRDFEAVIRGCVKAGRSIRIYSNLEQPIPASMDDLTGRMHWRLSCHSQSTGDATAWLARALEARERGWRLTGTTVYCPPDVLEVLRDHGIVVDAGQQKPQDIPPPVRCIVNRVYLAPDGRRYHCVGKMAMKDPTGVVALAGEGTSVCISPWECAPCDSVVATRIAIE